MFENFFIYFKFKFKIEIFILNKKYKNLPAETAAAKTAKTTKNFAILLCGFLVKITLNRI